MTKSSNVSKRNVSSMPKGVKDENGNFIPDDMHSRIQSEIKALRIKERLVPKSIGIYLQNHLGVVRKQKNGKLLRRQGKIQTRRFYDINDLIKHLKTGKDDKGHTRVMFTPDVKVKK